MKRVSWRTGFFGVIAAAVIYILLAPVNLPLYSTIMFPFPDPRTPDVKEEMARVAKMGVKRTDVTLKSRNGNLLHAWFFELPGSKRVFLFSHGKGNNIYARIPAARLLLACGGSVLMYDYQGFGNSQGRASIDGACDDAVAAYDYLVKERHCAPHDIILFGQSFGTGVSGELVKRRQVGGVVLQSGFSSLVRAARDTLPWLRLYPDWAFPPAIAMDNTAIFSKPHPPVLIIHGDRDRTLPIGNAKDLFVGAVEPKEFLLIPGGKHGAFGTEEGFVATMKGWMGRNGI